MASHAQKTIDPPQSAVADPLSILNIRNILTIAMVGFAVYLLVVIRGVLALFLSAMVIAFLLYPIVQWIARLPLGRGKKLGAGPAILILYLLLASLLTLIVVFAGGLLAEQYNELTDYVKSPKLATDAVKFKNDLLLWAQPLANANLIEIKELDQRLTLIKEDFLTELSKLLSGLDLGSIASNIFGNAGQIITVMVSLPILVFYMIVDAHTIRGTILNFVPPAFQDNALDFLGNLERTLNSYLRGQIKLGFSIFLLDAVLLLLFVPHVTAWLLIALIAGITEIIPVVGPLIALVVALIVAGLQTGGDVATLGKIVIIFTGVQMIENQFLVPRIMGKQLDVHPLTVMFFLFAGTVLGGATGALLSLPIAATLKVLVQQYYPTFIRRVQALLTDDDRETGIMESLSAEEVTELLRSKGLEEGGQVPAPPPPVMPETLPPLSVPPDPAEAEKPLPRKLKSGRDS